MTSPIRSVLADVQEARGAGFLEDAGWTWVTTFGDPEAEYEAVRADVAIWDVYALQKWEVRGHDACAAVQRTFANDLANLAVGQVKYGPFVDEHAMMYDDGTVYKHGDDHYWVMTNGGDYGDRLAAAAPGLAVTAVNRTFEMPVISVQGPRSRALVQSLTTTDLSGLRYFRFLPERIEVAGVPAWVLRTGFSGELGFELIPDAGDAVHLWTTLRDNGARQIGLDAIEMVRIEAGLIIAAVDYQPGATSPFDLSLDKTVATGSEANFLGKEALTAAAAAPPNRFKTLRITGDVLPEYGADVRLGAEVVGTVTSPVSTPRFGVIGLAVLRTDLAFNGVELEVVVGDGTVQATVDDLSIHDPEKRKPRS